MKRKGKKRVKGGKRKGEEKRERKLNEGEKIGGRKEKEKQYEAKKKGKVRGEGERKGKGKVTCQYCAHPIPGIGTVQWQIFYLM